MKTKAISFNNQYFLLPQGTPSAKELASFLSANFNRFIVMMKLDEDAEKFPYFLESKKKEVYVNVHNISQFEEVEIELLPDAQEDE